MTEVMIGFTKNLHLIPDVLDRQVIMLLNCFATDASTSIHSRSAAERVTCLVCYSPSPRDLLTPPSFISSFHALTHYVHGPFQQLAFILIVLSSIIH